MTARERFWEHVNAALDERRDPANDAAVQQLVVEESELVAELERLRVKTQELRRSRSRARVRMGAVVAGIAIAAGLLAWRRASPGTMPEPTPASDPAVLARRDRVPGDAIVSFYAEVVVESAAGRTITRFDGERLQRVRETLLQAPSPAGPVASGLVARIQSTTISNAW